MFDIVIRHGSVIDGTGTPRRRADVGIVGDRVSAIGDLSTAETRSALDATGCVVSPGFVDMHSHADSTLPILPTADSFLRQGITTTVFGMCGGTPVPLLDETRELVIARRKSDEYDLPWEEWSTYGSYLAWLKDLGISLNVVPLVGQGTIRSAVLGFSADAPNADQLVRMQAQVVQAMDEGAIGLSTGLIYPPGSYASTEELIEVTRPAGERDGFYFSHIRGEAAGLLDAVAEAIRIGRETGAAVQIAHFKAQGEANWHLSPKALKLVDQARAEGVDVTTDMYPYVAGSSSLVSMLPQWGQVGGKEATLARLGDRATRARLAEDMSAKGFFRSYRWDQILIAESPKNRVYEGRYVSDLAAKAGKESPDWVFDALLETGLQIQMIAFYASEENLRAQLRHPRMMVGTDGSGRGTEGPLSQGKPHPRSYGTFPRILGRYVREQGVIPLEEAIRKITGLPAEKLRWTDRGLLREGYRADLVVFDPETVMDRATYEDPHQYPVGIRHVLVNGRIVVRDETHTGARPGRVLGRT